MNELANKRERFGATTLRRRMQWAVQVAVLLGLAWLALAGFDDWLVGALLVTVAAAFGAWLAPGEVHRWRPLRLLGFAAWFVWTSWRGGVDVARRAMAPSLPVAPQLHRHRLVLPPGLPRTMFIAVLSLLPGTLSVDLDINDDRGDVLVVHVLAAEALASVFVVEQWIGWLFSLPEPMS